MVIVAIVVSVLLFLALLILSPADKKNLSYILKKIPRDSRGIFHVTKSGDLEESRTPIDGMKTRCTNRYTTRP